MTKNHLSSDKLKKQNIWWSLQKLQEIKTSESWGKLRDFYKNHRVKVNEVEHLMNRKLPTKIDCEKAGVRPTFNCLGEDHGAARGKS